MKTTININGKYVEITLTKEQVEKIKKASLKITDRLKTWEDACEIAGIDSVKFLPYQSPKNDFEEAINATAQLFVIVELLCEGWKPNWENSSQYKWYPYFKYTDSGFGFSSSTYWYARTRVGSRLVLPTSELANYAGTQFIEIYKKFLTK